MRIALRSVYTIAKKEFADNVRNKWILSLVAIFLVLAIASSFVAGLGRVGEMDATVGFLITISSMLVPIISIMLGYATISGEAESGALSVVLACPIRRIEVLLGKLVGLGSVICLSIFVGFGISGILIAASTGRAEWSGYIGFILLTMLLGMLYLSVSVCISSILKRRVTSLGAGVIVFFWGAICGFIWIGLYAATGGNAGAFLAGETSDLPDWFWIEVFLSPQDGSGTAAMLAFGETEILGYSVSLPSWVNLGTLVLAHLIWTLVPIALAYVWFQRRDV
ncbi:TPA: ABC transporter permease [Thermoplasmata archaeon]|nr:ABC transporter permease [Thermoplasmata archaeon]